MRFLCYIAAVGCSLSLGLKLCAKEPAAADGASEADQQFNVERQQRIDFMRATLRQYAVVPADGRRAPLALREEPALRYTNPVRNFFTDGAVFLWLEGEHPLAAAAPSIRGQGNVFCELTSLTARSLECRRDGRTVWSPRSGNLVNQPLTGAPPPSESKNARLRQMRDAARRFRVITKSQPDVELRLMAQPIYRYAAQGDGNADGGVFAFVEATDPDFLLLVESRRDSAAAAEWRYTLARLCSRPVEVELDGKQVWSADSYWKNPRSPTDPYAELPLGTYSTEPVKTEE